MTQVSSTNTKNSFFNKAFKHNFIADVRENLRLMIVIFVLHFAAAPLFLLCLITKILTEGSNEVEEFILVAGGSTCLAAASGLLCVIGIFRYLYNKSAVDMKLSLPMTTTQRFVSDFSAGLFVYIVPYLVSSVFTWIMMLVGHNLCDGRTFCYIPRYDDRKIEWICNMFSETAPFLWKGMLGGLLLMICFYVVSILVASCCGSLFECTAYNIILNIVVPVSVAVGVMSVTESVPGLFSDHYLAKVLPYCGPGGGIYGIFLVLTEEYEGGLLGSYAVPFAELSFGKWAALFTLVTILLGGLAYFVYRQRKAEDTGKPVVYGIIYHIVLTFGVFLITFVYNMAFPAQYIPLVFIIVICYMIMHVIRNRGFSDLMKGCILCGITTIAAIGSYKIVTDTEAFGAGKYVPDKDDVVSARASYLGACNNDVYNSYGGTGKGYAEFKDKDRIEVLLKAHEALVNTDEFTRNYYYVEYANSYSVEYKLRSGRTVYRYYNELTSDALRYLSELDGCEEINRQKAENVRNYILSIPENIKGREAWGDSDLKDLTPYVELDPQWNYRVLYSTDYADGVRLSTAELPADFLGHLADCVYNDIMADCRENYSDGSGEMWRLTLMTRPYTIALTDDYTETIAYLKSVGFTDFPSTSKEMVKYFAELNYENGISMASTELAEYLTGRDMFVSANTAPAIPYNVSDNNTEFVRYTVDSTMYTRTIEYSDDLYELVLHSNKAYRTANNCYVICINGNRAVIPEEYSDMAEKMFIRMTYDQAAYVGSFGLWDDPAAYFENSGNSYYYAYSEYLRGFIECYGKDRIISAFRYSYDGITEDEAEELYNNLVKWSQTNTDIYSQIETDYAFDNAVRTDMEIYSPVEVY